MKFSRFLTWLMAMLLTAGGALVIARYGLAEPNWGIDAVWMVLAAIVGTRPVQSGIEDMWSRR